MRLLLFLVPLALFAQGPTTPPAITATTVTPAGACSVNQGRLVGPGGTIYTCQNGTWGQAGGGGSGTVTSVTGTAPVVITSTPTTTPNVTVNGLAALTGAVKANGSGAVTQAACADLSNAAASCSTDATNASNISSGTLAAARVAGVPFATPGSSHTLSGSYDIFVCTTTCTITVPVPVGQPNTQQFCVMNDDNVSTIITLSAIGSSAMYENQARTAYGTAGTGTLVTGGAVKDMVCIVGRDSTHYLTTNCANTCTVN